MDAIRMAIMIEDANKHLRNLFPDYDEQAEPARKVLRTLMHELQTDNVLKALTEALKRVQDKYGDSQTASVHTLWFCAAAVDLLKEK